jgi:hypothetical protein
MNSSDKNISPGFLTDEDGDSALGIPLQKTNLADFVTRLLGHPQQLRPKTAAHFIMDHDWLIHLSKFIEQRVLR